MTVKEVLIAARVKIAEPENWTQGESARDKDGARTFAGSFDATCWCATGAVTCQPINGREMNDALWVLDNATGLRSGNKGLREIAIFNDTHTHAEVLALFDKAIESAA